MGTQFLLIDNLILVPVMAAPSASLAGETDSESNSSLIMVIKTASAPFDKIGADVILRTSDQVDFYVYKAVLLLASDFFEDMFSLQQPAVNEADKNDQTYPIIDMAEDSQTLDDLLRLCYPVDDPNIDDFKRLDSVLAAATKYETREAIKILRETFLRLIPSSPRRAISVACRYQLEPEACVAAKLLKTEVVQGSVHATDFAETLPGSIFVPEMRNMTAGPYYRLLLYLRTGRLPSAFCQPHSQSSGSTPRDLVDWKSIVDRADADVILRSFDEVDFRAHRVILEMNRMEGLLSRAEPVDFVDGLHVLRVDIDSHILGKILLLCYPRGEYATESTDPESLGSDSRLVSDVVDVAIRYEIKPVVRTIRASWSRQCTQDPLARYLIASRAGWKAEAQEAAKCLLDRSIDQLYSSELEQTPAIIYQSLLDYHHRCQIAAMATFASRGVYLSGSKGHYNIDIATSGRWRKDWFAVSGSESVYVRSIPSILVELEAEKTFKLKSTSSDPPSSVISNSRKLHSEVEQVLRGVSAVIHLAHQLTYQRDR